jgi:hypothetical protein
MGHTFTGKLDLSFRDDGYYYDDPVYEGQGTVGEAYVKLQVPCKPGMGGGGRFRVIIIVEKEEE